MPWSKKTQKLAKAVAHGFHPTGPAKGFSKKFAEQVNVESNYEEPKKGKAKRGRK